MEYKNRWEIIEELGEGGQGKVYRVLDKDRFHTKRNLQEMLKASITKFAGIQDEPMKQEALELFSTAVLQIIQEQDVNNHGALKVLHKPEEARDAKRAEERIKREIQAMSEIKHPNLLTILDADPDSKWFVSQYYPKGTLVNSLNRFAGDFAKALRAFRPLVEGVSRLHKKGIVHRDIKPQNVFIDSDDNLVLGDFGLVFFTDQGHTRISGTWENVGSRDWMPAWAMGKIEDIKPSFDVFSLGKLFWSMLSGSPFLRLWYFDRGEFDLEKKFPDVQSMKFANPLLKKCLVEDEGNCLSDAAILLDEIDELLFIIGCNADLISPKVKRRCKVCGIGDYTLIVDSDSIYTPRNLGLNPTDSNTFKSFTCNHCGHVQLFFFPGQGKMPPAWGEGNKRIKMDRKLKAQMPYR
ncbi:MAG: protein kinase domain-containing protein [bacterium]